MPTADIVKVADAYSRALELLSNILGNEYKKEKTKENGPTQESFECIALEETFVTIESASDSNLS